MQTAVERHYTIIEKASAAHGAIICDRAGDGVFAILPEGNPLACALDIQRALTREDWSGVGGLRVRIGVHLTALDANGNAERLTANRGSRITECAWGGQILTSQDAAHAFATPAGARLVDFGPQHLRGIAAPIRIYGLVHPELPQQDFQRLRSGHEWALRLPAELGPIFGRDRELEEIETAIERGEQRLLTLVAPGGTGKTRLLIELARRISYKRLVCFVALQDLRETSIALAVARSLQLHLKPDRPELQQLVAHLHDRACLLALDSAETAPELASFTTEILAQCPNVRIVAASRSPVGASGEQLFRVGGLSCAGSAVDQVRASPAYEMFADQASRFDGGFALGAADAEAFHRICKRVGGSPLALKLTARWRRVLSLPQIDERLSEGVEFLDQVQLSEGSPRSVFEGAWRLLTSSQQRCLARLSVFAGGFAVKDAEPITEAPAATFIELEDRGLIQREPGGRFTLHALIHEYARDRLNEEIGEARETRLRHANHFLSRLKPPVGADQGRLLDEINGELGNIEAAISCALIQGLPIPLTERLEALFYALIFRSRFHEGERIFSLTDDGELGAHLAALRANCLVHTGRIEEAITFAQGVLASTQRPCARAHAWQALGNSAHLQGRYAEAQHFYEQALVLRENDVLGRPYTCLCLGWVDLAQGRPQSARRWVRESYRICRQSDDAAGLMHTYMLGGDVAVAEQRLEDARANYLEVLDLEEIVGEPQNRAATLALLAGTLVTLGEHANAVERASQALDLSEQLSDERVGAAARIERARGRQGLGDVHGARSDLVLAFRSALKLKAAPLLSRALSALAILEESAGNHEYAARLTGALERGQNRLSEATVDLATTERGSEFTSEIEDLVIESEFAQARL